MKDVGNIYFPLENGSITVGVKIDWGVFTSIIIDYGNDFEIENVLEMELDVNETKKLIELLQKAVNEINQNKPK